MIAVEVFKRAAEAIRAGKLIRRESTKDKEFHFQNWFGQRLAELGSPFKVVGRNSYPDFRMVATTEGYELKGLAYPGATSSFDSNSQIHPAITTGARSTTSSVVTRPNPTVTRIRFWTWSSATAIS